MPKRDHWMAPVLGKKSDEPNMEDERWIVPRDSNDHWNLVGSTVEAEIRHDEYAQRDASEEAVHMPVLDIDHMCFLMPSETPGHFHLYIDVPMTWEQYEAIIVAMGNAGVLEPGYVSASLSRRCTYVSPKPWKEQRVEH